MGQRQPGLLGNLSVNATQTITESFHRSSCTEGVPRTMLDPLTLYCRDTGSYTSDGWADGEFTVNVSKVFSFIFHKSCSLCPSSQIWVSSFFLSWLSQRSVKEQLHFYIIGFVFFQSSAGFFFRLDTSFYLEFSKANGGGGKSTTLFKYNTQHLSLWRTGTAARREKNKWHPHVSFGWTAFCFSS